MYRAIDMKFRGVLNTDYALHDLHTALNLVGTAVASFARSSDCMKFSIAAPGITTGKIYSLRMLTTSGVMIADAELL
jgi:hypothetical protein